MSHAQAWRPAEYTPKASYIIIVAIIFAAVVFLVMGRGIITSVDHSTAPKSESTNSATEGSTKATGAPTTDTGTPADRTVPSPGGGGANTLLNPE